MNEKSTLVTSLFMETLKKRLSAQLEILCLVLNKPYMRFILIINEL